MTLQTEEEVAQEYQSLTSTHYDPWPLERFLRSSFNHFFWAGSA